MNRRDKRAHDRFKKEVDKYLGWVPEKFEQALFGDNPFSYLQLFMAYNSIWQKLAHWFNRKKANGFSVDSLWFYNTYRPLENL